MIRTCKPGETLKIGDEIAVEVVKTTNRATVLRIVKPVEVVVASTKTVDIRPPRRIRY